MAQQIVNTGIVANDGVGDPLRTSMQKVNNNFSEFYSVFVPGSSNNVTASNNLTVTANVISNNIFANTKLKVGSAAGYDFGSLAIIEIDASQNTYVQSVIQNANSGTNASGDLVITADTGNDSVNYVDFGINSSTYSNTTYTIAGALDAYLYTSNTNLTIGTASAKEVIFHAGGTLAANKVLTINATAVTVVNSISLVANGASGAAGQVLTSNGSALYWGNPSVNVTAQYSWTNTQSFSNTITFGNSTSNSTLTAAITLRQSNSTVNASMNSNTVQIANSTGNTQITATSLLTQTSATVNSNISATQISVANSTGNIAVTATSVTLSNSTAAFLVANATGVYATVNAVFNSTNLLYTGNTTTQPTVTLANTGSFTIGNSSTTQTTSTIAVANSVGNIAITPTSVALSNTTQPIFVANSTAVTAFNKIQIGNNAINPYSYGTAAAVEVDLSSNGFVQVVIQNSNTQLNASSDLVAAADSGNDVSNYVDLGINSSTYSNASYNIGGALDAYLYASNGALTIGTASVKDVVIHAGGTTTTNRILTVNTSAVTVNTSANLTVLSNTFNLGTSNVAGHTTYGAGGYTYLPNGLKMIFGAITTANSTANIISFSAQSGVSFTSNCYSLTLTSNAVASVAAAYTVNATSFTLITNSATASTVSFMAIGI